MSRQKPKSTSATETTAADPKVADEIEWRRKQLERDILCLELIEAKRRMHSNPTMYRDWEREIIGRNLQYLEPPRNPYRDFIFPSFFAPPED
jgi:hypothetical protein